MCCLYDCICSFCYTFVLNHMQWMSRLFYDQSINQLFYSYVQDQSMFIGRQHTRITWIILCGIYSRFGIKAFIIVEFWRCIRLFGNRLYIHLKINHIVEVMVDLLQYTAYDKKHVHNTTMIDPIVHILFVTEIRILNSHLSLTRSWDRRLIFKLCTWLSTWGLFFHLGQCYNLSKVHFVVH